MPNIKSAKKRVKIIAAKTLRNKMLRSSLRTAIKKAELAVTSADSAQKEAVIAAISKIDKAVSKGILHKNTAARKKSALMHKLGKTA